MVFVLKNFIRNGMAADYYRGCLVRGIVKIEDSTHPNLYALGKEMYEAEQSSNSRNVSRELLGTQQIPKPRKSLDSRANFDSLIKSVRRDVPIFGKVEIMIDSSVKDRRQGVDFDRKYIFAGRTFVEPNCHYDTRQEFESEEFESVVNNLRRALSPYVVEVLNKKVLVRNKE